MRQSKWWRAERQNERRPQHVECREDQLISRGPPLERAGVPMPTGRLLRWVRLAMACGSESGIGVALGASHLARHVGHVLHLLHHGALTLRKECHAALREFGHEARVVLHHALGQFD